MGSLPTLTRHGPVLHASWEDRSGHLNVNGPALVAAPSWVRRPVGRYYLYFAQHRGSSIWMASSDHMIGPWRISSSPVLSLQQTHYSDHIASPDVVVDEVTRTVRMYFHGGYGTALEEQSESVAISHDGLTFELVSNDIGAPYWRVFRCGQEWMAVVMPGTLIRSATGLDGFEVGPTILPARTRHSAVALIEGGALIFYSLIDDCPEKIWCGSLCMDGPWETWSLVQSEPVLEPEEEYEGAQFPSKRARRGQALYPGREVRDPGCYVAGDRVWLSYVGGGERCIAIASMDWVCESPSVSTSAPIYKG